MIILQILVDEKEIKYKNKSGAVYKESFTLFWNDPFRYYFIQRQSAVLLGNV